MKIYPYVFYRREITETDLQFAEIMRQLWIAEWKWLLFIKVAP